jgi:DNA-binding CsgD family transcriptional regulator
LPHLLPHLISESASARGFSPEPQLGALLTGLLELIASDFQAPDALSNVAAAEVAELIGDACVVCLLVNGDRTPQPVAVADRDEAGAALLRPLTTAPLRAGRRPELGPYVARYELADELIVPMRSRGRVIGELVALRRGENRPYNGPEKRALQAVADLLALGIGDRRLQAAAADVPAPDKLSRREREVLALLALGHTNREIAEQVHLSIRTVEWHRARIQAKLRVTGRAALAQVARAHGLLNGTDEG